MSPRSSRGSPRTPRARNRESARAAARAAREAALDAETAAAGVGPRTGVKRTLADTIRQIPLSLRLLAGLLTDRRVAGLDKLLVAGAIAYILLPIDIIPDYIPFMGQVDDIYLLVVALERLIGNAGRRVVADHWSGPIADLSAKNLRGVLMSAAFFLPRRMRRRLRVIGRM